MTALLLPKVLVGQSYGGLRTPRVADALRPRRGVAANGLLSPVLDYGWRYHARTSPLSFATLLPSFAAARLKREGGL
jgi:carboxypeptidase C (cathepsin A)